MKKVKLIMLVVTTMLFMGIGNVIAQEKVQEFTTVIVSGFTYSGGSESGIETIKPDYSLELKKYGKKDKKNLLVEIKRELDFWINQGYEIIQTNNNGLNNLAYRYTYILIKK